MSDISLVFIAIGGATFLKHAWDYRNHRVPDRNVEVNRIKDLDVFCRYASRYSLMNAAIVFALFMIVVSQNYFAMPFNFSWYFGLLIIFLYRIFRFPRSFEKFYRPITLDTPVEEEPLIDEKEVDQ